MTTNPFTRLLGWLRGGYPQGVPQSDYVALFGILHRDLTETEVTEIAVALRKDRGVPDSEISREEIAAGIRRVAMEKPSEEDIARVAGRLAAGGWPLATGAAPAEPVAQHDPHDPHDDAVGNPSPGSG